MNTQSGETRESMDQAGPVCQSYIPNYTMDSLYVPRNDYSDIPPVERELRSSRTTGNPVCRPPTIHSDLIGQQQNVHPLVT